MYTYVSADLVAVDAKLANVCATPPWNSHNHTHTIQTHSCYPSLFFIRTALQFHITLSTESMFSSGADFRGQLWYLCFYSLSSAQAANETAPSTVEQRKKKKKESSMLHSYRWSTLKKKKTICRLQVHTLLLLLQGHRYNTPILRLHKNQILSGCRWKRELKSCGRIWWGNRLLLLVVIGGKQINSWLRSWYFNCNFSQKYRCSFVQQRLQG